MAGNHSINIGLDDVTLLDGNCSEVSIQGKCCKGPQGNSLRHSGVLTKELRGFHIEKLRGTQKGTQGNLLRNSGELTKEIRGTDEG